MIYSPPKILITAYMVKLLAVARTRVAISDRVLLKALNYLKSKQMIDGSFLEYGNWNYFSNSFGANYYNTLELTAFVAIAFLENEVFMPQFEDVVNKTMEYLSSRIFDVRDNCAIAITAYALSLYKPHEENAFVEQLRKTAIEHDNMMYWHQQISSTQHTGSDTVDIRIASYAMMAFVKSGQRTDAALIMNWLIKQKKIAQYFASGYSASIDVVVAIQALTMMAEKFLYSNPNVTVNLKTDLDDEKKTFIINDKNARELQTEVLNPDTRAVDFYLRGRGYAYVQLSYQYNTKINEIIREFDLNVIVQPSSTETANVLHLRICAKYLENETIGKTLMEINLPSGYVYNNETAELVKKVGVRVRMIFTFTATA